MTPWPTNGIRRASVASFGFGGSNAHAILDDAYHYLNFRNLCARHCTLVRPPCFEYDSFRRTVSEMDTFLTQPSFRSTLEAYEPTKSMLPVNGIPTDTRSVNAMNVPTSNGINSATTVCTINGVNGALREHTKSRIFVWSAAEEAGLERLARRWQEYFSRLEVAQFPGEDDYMRELAHTLAFDRTSLPWKSYAIADSISTLTKGKESMSKPVQSNRHHGLGYIFTGQGAQYSRMGADLMSYPVFRHSLEAFDKGLRDLGCPWSIFGQCP